MKWLHHLIVYQVLHSLNKKADFSREKSAFLLRVQYLPNHDKFSISWQASLKSISS